MINPRKKLDLEEVYNYILANHLTMVTPERYVSIDKIARIVEEENIEGDIVECGCWRGGMSIYMAYSFPDRPLWACDSFAGFEPIEKRRRLGAKIDIHHSMGLTEVWAPGNTTKKVSLSAPYDNVVDSFKAIGLSENTGVTLVKGYVQDSLYTEEIQDIKKIALLRIDVDAYSATYDVLEALYDKVVPGGYVVFDDSAIPCTREAIEDFSTAQGIDIPQKLLSPNLEPAQFPFHDAGQIYKKGT